MPAWLHCPSSCPFLLLTPRVCVGPEALQVMILREQWLLAYLSMNRYSTEDVIPLSRNRPLAWQRRIRIMVDFAGNTHQYHQALGKDLAETTVCGNLLPHSLN